MTEEANPRARAESFGPRKHLERCNLIVELDNLCDSRYAVRVAHLREISKGGALALALRQCNPQDVADDRQSSRVKQNSLRHLLRPLSSWAAHRCRRWRSLKRGLCGERLRGTWGAPINMADSFRPLRFKLFTDSLKLVESSHLRRKLVVAKLNVLCTGKYRNDKLQNEISAPTVAASRASEGAHWTGARSGTRLRRQNELSARSLRRPWMAERTRL